MKYRWNGGHLTNVFILPAEVVDRHIRLAGAAQLKVLLWLSRRGDGEFDPAVCGKAIGLSAADCTDALQYWLETGVLLPGGEDEPAADTDPTGSAVTASVLAPPEETDLPAPSLPAESEPAPAEQAADPAAKTASTAKASALSPTPKIVRPVPVRPTMKEVIRRQKADGDFAYLLNAVSARLGRPITNPDMETLLYLYDTAGLPVEVVLMVVAYAVSREKPNLRYIEKVALDWADQGIDTLPAAEEHLCRLDRRNQAWAKLETILGIHRTPTVGQLDRAEQWIAEWELDDGLIRKAYEISREKTGKFQMTYMARILEGWREDGIKTPEQLAGETAPSAKKSPLKLEDTSLDTASYEQMMDRFVPIYPTNGKKA